MYSLECLWQWSNLADVIRLYVHSIEVTIYGCKDSEYKYFLYTLASVGHFFDIDMSYTRVLHIKVAYRIPHK
jgi:hypothetical protein